MGVLVLLLALADDAQWLSSHDEALQRAKQTGQPVLILAFDTT